MCSLRIHLFLDTLPYTFRDRLWHARWSTRLDFWYLRVAAKHSHPPQSGPSLRHWDSGSAGSFAHTCPSCGLVRSSASSPVWTVTRFRGTAPRWWALNLRTGIGRGDFVGLAGVRPDLLFATAEAPGGLFADWVNPGSGLHRSSPTRPRGCSRGPLCTRQRPTCPRLVHSSVLE